MEEINSPNISPKIIEKIVKTVLDKVGASVAHNFSLQVIQLKTEVEAEMTAINSKLINRMDEVKGALKDVKSQLKDTDQLIEMFDKKPDMAVIV